MNEDVMKAQWLRWPFLILAPDRKYIPICLRVVSCWIAILFVHSLKCAWHVGHRDAMRHVMTRTSLMKMKLKSRNPLLCNYLVEPAMHKSFLVLCLLAHIPDPKS